MQSISIELDLNGVKAIKRHLSVLSSDEKSSLLTEAIARGLQHRTHAALLVTLENEGSAIFLADAAAFQNYCQSKGRNIPMSKFLLALAQVAILNALKKCPMIGEFGYGYGRPEKIENRWETDKEQYDRFHRGRASLDSVFVAQQFLRSIYFLSKIPQIKTINTKISSYGLKHIAENMPISFHDGEILGPAYVGNASLILAALHLGLKFRTYRDDRGYDSPNMNFNLSHKAIVDVDCVVRPDGARAQDRHRKKR